MNEIEFTNQEEPIDSIGNMLRSFSQKMPSLNTTPIYKDSHDYVSHGQEKKNPSHMKSVEKPKDPLPDDMPVIDHAAILELVRRAILANSKTQWESIQPPALKVTEEEVPIAPASQSLIKKKQASPDIEQFGSHEIRKIADEDSVPSLSELKRILENNELTVFEFSDQVRVGIRYRSIEGKQQKVFIIDSPFEKNRVLLDPSAEDVKSFILLYEKFLESWKDLYTGSQPSNVIITTGKDGSLILKNRNTEIVILPKSDKPEQVFKKEKATVATDLESIQNLQQAVLRGQMKRATEIELVSKKEPGLLLTLKDLIGKVPKEYQNYVLWKDRNIPLTSKYTLIEAEKITGEIIPFADKEEIRFLQEKAFMFCATDSFYSQREPIYVVIKKRGRLSNLLTLDKNSTLYEIERYRIIAKIVHEGKHIIDRTNKESDCNRLELEVFVKLAREGHILDTPEARNVITELEEIILNEEKREAEDGKKNPIH